jgi:hypothetical protein
VQESNLESWNNLLKYLLPLLQLLILVIPFLGVRPLFDRSRTFWDRLSKRGYSLFFLGIILALLTIKQSSVTNDLETLSSVNSEKKSVRRDSINQKRNEYESYKTKEMLAKYGLQVDTKNNEIVKILRDPEQRQTTVVYGESPILDIANIKIDKEISSKFIFTVTSYDASSYYIDIKVDVLGVSSPGKLLLLKKDLDLFQSMSVIKKDQSIDCFTDIKIAKDYQMLYFRFCGTYQKHDGTIIPVENYSAYDKREFERPFGYPKKAAIAEIKNYYKTFGLK